MCPNGLDAARSFGLDDEASSVARNWLIPLSSARADVSLLLTLRGRERSESFFGGDVTEERGVVRSAVGEEVTLGESGDLTLVLDLERQRRE